MCPGTFRSPGCAAAVPRWRPPSGGTGLLLHGRITAADYQARMARLANGEWPPGTTRHANTREGGRHG
ncbi:hypothetical protein [Streptomyces sp. NPDC002671]